MPFYANGNLWNRVENSEEYILLSSTHAHLKISIIQSASLKKLNVIVLNFSILVSMHFALFY